LPKTSSLISNESGVQTAVHTEDGDGTFHVTKKQDVQPTLDYTKYLREQPVDRKNEVRHIAEIPPVVAAKLIRDGIMGDSKAILKWLDKPENKVFKTVEGRLS
tara:strand:+ start:230 stop:538 length:309 start_codon:yes stop_codon:yes gene_type:complete